MLEVVVEKLTSVFSLFAAGNTSEWPQRVRFQPCKFN